MRSHLEIFTIKLLKEGFHEKAAYHDFKNGNYRKARHKISNKNPESRDALAWLLYGWTKAKGVNFQGALKCANKVIKKCTTPDSSEPSEDAAELPKLVESGGFALCAEMHLHYGDYSKALDSASAAINRDSSYEPAYVIRARVYLNQGEWQAAIENSIDAIELNNEYVPAYIVLAQAYLRNEKYDEAIQVAKAALALPKNNNNVMAHAILSDAYAKKGNHTASFEAAHQALEAYKELSSKRAKDLSPSERDFLNLEPADMKELKARCALDKAIKDLEKYRNKLDAEYVATLNSPHKLTQHLDLKLKVGAIESLLGNKLHGAFGSLVKGIVNEEGFFDSLHSQDEELGKHRGYGKIIKNIALAAGLLGVGYVFVGLIHLAGTRGKHFTFFNDTTTMKKVKAIDKHAHALIKAQNVRK